ncbi:MAG: SAF domain-containing protein [Myxococcota bacterium]
MTPQQGRSSGFVVGVALGLAVSVVVLIIGGVAGLYWVEQKAHNAKKGWNLVPIVVAAVDLSEGAMVTMENISQRSIPEQFVTSSVVKPDAASYIVNQKILVPVQAGDPLLWTQFETKKKTVVLFAVRDVPPGRPLAQEDTEERGVEEALLTRSWVRTEDRPNAVGRKVLAPFRAGDPILWTHLEAQK